MELFYFPLVKFWKTKYWEVIKLNFLVNWILCLKVFSNYFFSIISQKPLVYRLWTHFLKTKSGQLGFYSNLNTIGFSIPKTEIRNKRKRKQKEKIKREKTTAHLGRTREPAGPDRPRTSPTPLPPLSLSPPCRPHLSSLPAISSHSHRFQ
jgi:hypothetical protein